MITATARWNPAFARSVIRATFTQCAAVYNAADLFDRVDLARAPAFSAALGGIHAAWEAEDLGAVQTACARLWAAVREEGVSR